MTKDNGEQICVQREIHIVFSGFTWLKAIIKCHHWLKNMVSKVLERTKTFLAPENTVDKFSAWVKQDK